MEEETFTSRQREILSRLRDITKLNSEGIVKSPLLVPGRGSYLVALLHKEHITNPLSELSQRIASTTPALLYHHGNFHTTSLNKGQAHFEADEEILEKLADAARKVTGRARKVTLSYDEIIFSQESVIVTGTSIGFVELANDLLEILEGIEMKPPWNSHITISRFTEETRPSQLEGLFELMEKEKFSAVSKPVELGVGYTSMSIESVFQFNILDKFPL